MIVCSKVFLKRDSTLVKIFSITFGLSLIRKHTRFKISVSSSHWVKWRFCYPKLNVASKDEIYPIKKIVTYVEIFSCRETFDVILRGFTHKFNKRQILHSSFINRRSFAVDFVYYLHITVLKLLSFYFLINAPFRYVIQLTANKKECAINVECLKLKSTNRIMCINNVKLFYW